MLKDHDFFQIREIVDRIQQMILLKQEIGLGENDYTLLKELFGQSAILLDGKQKQKLH